MNLPQPPAPVAPAVRPRRKIKKKWGLLALSPAALLTQCAPQCAPPPAAGATVAHVVDGDTIDLSNGQRVRVIGIDTPEQGECGHAEATARLSALVLDQPVATPAGARDDRDDYGRLLRYVDGPSGDAGLVLIQEGLAIARYDSRDGYGGHPREAAYVAADAATPNLCSGPPTPAPAPQPGAATYANCTDVWNRLGRPITARDPGFEAKLDRDNDGIGCESRP